MSNAPNIKRNLEAGQFYIPSWVNGIHVNRSPLFTPLSAMGAQMISRFDTLWGGNNMELSMQNTLVRRPGYPKWCTSAFGSAEFPLQFYSYQNLNGTISTLVDTQTNTYTFTPTGKSSIVAKLSGAVQTAFQRIGQALYMANGKSLQASGDDGTLGPARPVGIAVPAVAPTFVLGVTGSLLPAVGFSYGYSYAASVSGHVSTMSPLSADVGDLNVQSVTEGEVSCEITLVTSVVSGDGPGTVTFSTPNGNNFSVGQTIVVTGFPVTTAGTYVVNNKYVVTAAGAGFVSASTAVWGPAYHGPSGHGFGQNCAFIQPTVGCFATLNPITIPGASGPGTSYTYTVVNVSNFAPTNLFGAVTPSPVSVKSPGGTKVYTQIASGTPSTGQFVVDATGDFTFAAADTGLPIVVTYAVTPTTGATPVSVILSGPASNNQFSTAPSGANGVGSNGQQTDLTGFGIVDTIVIYRDQDSDLSVGPWFFLAQIPNNITLVAATVLSQSNQVQYTFGKSCSAGANNGFAGATGTLGATIAGFVNSGNNGNFDIIASDENSITCTNSGGTTEGSATAFVNSDSWTYTDTGSVYGYQFNNTIPDGELDILIEAPIADENNPPPNTTNPITTSVDGTFSLLAYGAGRMWGAVDNFVYFAGGPDVTFGNGNESWPPANVFTFPGKVTALASVPAGIVVFTADDMYIIYGTSTSTFYPQVYQKNFGVASQNCIVLDGDTLYIYSNSGQLWEFTNRLKEIGLNIAPYLGATFSPPTTYLTMHKNGEDVGLFISDGATNYARYRIDEDSWSPLCQIVGGASCFQSIETSAGVYTLMVGSAAGSGFIAARDLTTWSDIGGTYACNGIVGSIIVSPPGGTAVVDSIQIQYVNTGSDPTISFLPQDYAPLSGSVTKFTALQLVNDPPKLIPSGTAQFKQKRAYLKSSATPIAQEMSNLQINIAFPSENFKAEVLTMGVA